MLQFAVAAPIVVVMGDKSPKSKQRDQKQKSQAKAISDLRAKSKQDSYSRPPAAAPKGKK